MSARPRTALTVFGMLFCCGIFGFSAAAQESDTGSVKTDSLGTALTAFDSTGRRLPIASDSISMPSPDDGSAGVAKAPPPAMIPEKKSEGIKLVKRSYNGRRQVVFATGMMIFVVAIMTAAQQWNPR